MSVITQKYLQTVYYGQEYYQTIEIKNLNTRFVSSSNVPKGLRYHIEYDENLDTTFITLYGKVEQEPEDLFTFYFTFVNMIVRVNVNIVSSQVEATDYTSTVCLDNGFAGLWRKFKSVMLELEGNNIFSVIKSEDLVQAFYANNCINIDFNDVLKFDITTTVSLNKSNRKALSYVALSNPRLGLPTLMFWSYPDSVEMYFGVAKLLGDGEDLEIYNLFYKTSLGWIHDTYVSDIHVVNGNWFEYKQNVEPTVFSTDVYNPYNIEIYKHKVKTDYKIKMPYAPKPNEALYQDFNNLVSVFDKPKLMLNNDLNYVEGDHTIDDTVYKLLDYDRPLRLTIEGFDIKYVRDSNYNAKYGLIGLKVKDLNDSRDYNLALQEYLVGRDDYTPDGERFTSFIPMNLEYKHLNESKHYIATLNGLKYTIDQQYGKTKDIYPEWMEEWEPFIPLLAVKVDYINRVFGLLLNNYQFYEYFYHRSFTADKVGFDPYFDSISSPLKRFNVDISNDIVYNTEINDKHGKLFTLTVVPDPEDALVELSAEGYEQEGNSISVEKGIAVDCRVSKQGYTTYVKSLVVNNAKTLNVKLNQAYFVLTIEPTPSDATVVLTAEGYEQTGNSIEVAAGTTVAYNVYKEGYEPVDDTIEVNEATTLLINMVQAHHTLTIEAIPDDAIVVLTAEGYEQEGNSITVLYGTEVLYTVSKIGYVTESNFVTVNRTETKVIELEEELFRFTVNTVPTDATVVLTAEGYPQTGVNYIDVPVNKEVTYQVAKDHYQTVNGTETITENKTINVSMVFENYTVILDTVPADAEVTFSTGEVSGHSVTAPYNTDITCTVIRTGYITQTVYITTDATKSVPVELTKENYRLQVNTTPGDAEVTFSTGEVYGNICIVPYYTEVTFTATREDYLDYVDTIIVEDDTIINATMVKDGADAGSVTDATLTQSLDAGAVTDTNIEEALDAGILRE